jgi:hypothetical protein
MLTSRRVRLFLGVALALCLADGSAFAATGAVSVRVEGLTATLLPPTQTTTTNVPMSKDGNLGHACPGTTALAALNTATSGNWSGPWNETFNQYEVFSILGENHVFEPEATANYYWSFWLDERESQIGACEAQIEPGDRVLFFPSCYGSACPPAPSPLGIEAQASANVGEAVSVSVNRYGTGGEASPQQGATVAGASAPVLTDSTGKATVAFATPGSYMLRASAPEAVRTETAICVHAGNDGNCGTTAATPGTPAAPAAAIAKPYTGPYALVASVAGLIEGHVYKHHSAPRLLTGTIRAHSAVTSVSLELHRRYRGRCSAYDGTSEHFRRARCGHGSFFKVSSGGTFSYLLPAALAPGRYVLDVKATDVAGNQVALARGSSRIVFYVR